jgi:exonuclease SbcD
MRIIHTSDWHIGKKLYENDLEQDHQSFFETLIQIISNRKIDILIVSGDIFDSAYPSNQSLKLYFKTINRLRFSGLKHIFIVGGNHDSVSTLEAPKSLLETVNVHVVGGVPKTETDENDYDREIFEIKNDSGKIDLIICAVPFLRDRDIRTTVSGENSAEREKSIYEGIASHFSILAQKVKHYKERNIPIIVTGHLFASGASNSDSEREIYAGNLAKIESSVFNSVFDYVALGHIHRPQIINKNSKIRYSGSPVPLSFSERDDKKSVILIETAEGKISEPEKIELPVFRKLRHISGTFEEVKEKIRNLPKPENYKDLCEIEITESHFVPDLAALVEKFTETIENIDIARTVIKFSETVKGADELFESSVSIKDLSDIEVFEKLLDKENIENRTEILQTYHQIKQIIAENDC